MNRIFVFLALAVALILGVGALSAAQEARTPVGDVCASPVGSPEVGSPEATPVDVSLAPGVGPLGASPEATPEDVVVLGTPGVDRGASPEASPEATPELQFACASPAVGTPVTAGEAAIEASPV